MPIPFTDEQKKIFDFVKNENTHGIIDAVAGAGKTTTIMECANYITNKNDVLFCAFNNSIATEISRKFHERGINGVTVKTIHSLGWHILHANNSSGKDIKLENNKYQELLKAAEVKDALKPHYENILRINDLDPTNEFDDRNKFAVNNLLSRTSERLLEINQKFRATLTKENIEDFQNMVIHYGIFNSIEVNKKNFKEELLEYFRCTVKLLEFGDALSQRSMIIDYTDMLYLPYKWKMQPITKYGFLFIDECQDLSNSQFAIAAKYGRVNGRILAVGDPRQSIYGFTGADIDSFNRVKSYTKAVQLPLTTCFRCPKKVIELAKTIREDIIGTKTEDGNVTKISFDEVITLAKPGDLIISRLRAPLVLMVFTFIDKNIKVQIHEDEVREILNELKSIFKQNELNVIIATLPEQFERIKTEVMGRWKWIIKKNADRIVDKTERNIHIENETKYLEKKLEFLHKKYEQWKEECPNLTEIIKKIRDFISATDNPIKLSTIHRAKGLENDRVFVLNYDELPYVRLEQKDWEKTQELNLKYVAVTRAMKELFLIESKKPELIIEEGSLFDSLPFN